MTFDPEVDLLTELDENGLGQKVTCAVCLQVLFNLPRNSPEARRLLEGKGLAAHLELSHDMVAFYGRCGNMACKKFHLMAWAKDKLPPGMEDARSQCL